MKNSKSALLKIALFATGLSGIVAEYILSTLASYFLGDSVFQWTIVLSMMLFSMGLGSRISQYFREALLEKFLVIEFMLSFLVSFSAMFVYIVSGYTMYNGFYIYLLSILIGLMIGLEIPLVTRLNEAYEELRVNIASVMEKDYYGSLIGGLFFAFIGLPYLGLTYTPFVLGLVNFSVALILFVRLRHLIAKQYAVWLVVAASFLFLVQTTGLIFAKPIILFAEQKKYKDKVIFDAQSAYQKIVLTQWQDDYWLYLNGMQQFSTLDEVMYHEPLVHPAMLIAQHPQDILILGGGDGCAARNILQHSSVKSITVVDLDPMMTDLAKTHPVLLNVNDSSFYDPKVKIINKDAYIYMQNTQNYFDVIIIDLPDPRNVEINRLFTVEMYQMCYRHLRTNGVLITQSGSPYYATKAYECVNLSMQEAGFKTVRMHNQIITMGEWGWVIGTKYLESDNLKKRLQQLNFSSLKTEWITTEAMMMMTSFGNIDFFIKNRNEIEPNTIQNPVLYRYYLKGNWDLY
ncbi:MAG: polyamine aminopropyltransferase [Cytophagales bacterium]|nr:MAG: polyamine aminopropyltransferase [Cytophagales bacterium]